MHRQLLTNDRKVLVVSVLLTVLVNLLSLSTAKFGEMYCIEWASV